MKNQWGMLNGEWGKAPAPALRPRSPHSPFPTPHSPRAAVTLVELLIGMVIMAILAAAILGTAAAAMEAGRRSRTQSTITKIHNLIMDRLAEYETRRIPIHPEITGALDVWVASATNPTDISNRNVARGQMLADARLLGLRELMKMEMPDRAIDFEFDPLVLAARPPLAQAYYRRYSTAQAKDNDSAECLYLTLMNATGDGEARTLFREQEIGDVDNDGAPEILDGWGRPIGWIRWPAGYVSDLQPLNPDGTRVDRDPFDHFQRDSVLITGPETSLYPTARNFKQTYEANIRQRLTGSAPPAQKQAFRMVPLIYSGGPDGKSSMWHSNDITLDPYAFHTGDDGQPHLNGEPVNRNETLDNITNHLIEY